MRFTFVKYMDISNLSVEQLLELEGQVLKRLGENSTKVKVVVNRCYGGYNVSDILQKAYQSVTGQKLDPHYYLKHDRADKVLVYLVERLGEINKEYLRGFCSKLRVETIDLLPGRTYRIDEYDGMETLEMIPGNFIPNEPLPDNIDELFEKFLVEEGISLGKTKLM